MDKAKEIYGNGKEKVISADNIDGRTISYKEKRFICEYCGEYVTFVAAGKIKKNHFRHSNLSESSYLCELKSSLNESYSIYERKGLALYIKNRNKNIYEMFVGFSNLDTIKYNALINKNLTVTIKGNKSLNDYCLYKFNENNFYKNQLSLKKIDFFSDKYRIEYSTERMKNILKKVWGEEIEGIRETGSFFYYNKNGGKKIRINEDITNNEEYLYLGKNDSIFSRYNEINSELIGSIVFKGNISYKVYKVTLKIISDEKFKLLSEFFRENFKVSLIYKKSNMIPIWPPVVRYDQEIKYLGNSKEDSIWILEDNENKNSIYLHYNSNIEKIEGEKFSDKKSVIKIPIEEYQVPITIGEKYNSIFAVNNGYVTNIKEYENKLQIYDEKNSIILDDEINIISSKTLLKLKADSKIKVIQLKNNNRYVLKNININKEFIIDNIEFGDKILIKRGLKLIKILDYRKLVEKKDNNIKNLNEIYLKLINLKDYNVITPLWVKVKLPIFRKNKKLYKLISDYVLSNKIPYKGINILKSVFNQGEQNESDKRR